MGANLTKTVTNTMSNYNSNYNSKCSLAKFTSQGKFIEGVLWGDQREDNCKSANFYKVTNPLFLVKSAPIKSKGSRGEFISAAQSESGKGEFAWPPTNLIRFSDRKLLLISFFSDFV